jgi:hypothetical protein
MKRSKAILAVMLLVATAGIGLADDNPWHNYANPLDVDGNHLIQPRDALLIINELQFVHTDGLPAVATLDTTQQMYLDTTNDDMITPRDALLVINHLVLSASVPEPGGLVLAGLAVAALAAVAVRRKRLAAASV